MLYAAGHALVVFALGSLAIAFGRSLPESVDSVMEHVVGVTLIALGGVIIVELVRHGSEFRIEYLQAERDMVATTNVRRLWRRPNHCRGGIRHRPV